MSTIQQHTRNATIIDARFHLNTNHHIEARFVTEITYHVCACFECNNSPTTRKIYTFWMAYDHNLHTRRIITRRRYHRTLDAESLSQGHVDTMNSHINIRSVMYRQLNSLTRSILILKYHKLAPKKKHDAYKLA